MTLRRGGRDGGRSSRCRNVIRLGLVLAAAASVTVPSASQALVAPFPGSVSEVQSEFGPARIAGTRSGLLVTRPTYRVVQRWDFDRDPVTLATGIDAQLVAWDPSTDDAIVSTGDGRIVRLHGGATSEVASGLMSITGLDVGPDGTVYAAHVLPGRPEAEGVVTAFSNSTRRVVAGGGDGCRDVACKRRGAAATSVRLVYLTGLTVTPAGDVLVAENRLLHRVRAGVLQTIAGNARYCAPPDPCGDGGSALAAGFAEITSLDAAADGSIYLTEHRNARIRVIRPDGRVQHLVGSYRECVKVARHDCLPGFGPRSAIQKVVSIGLVGGHLFAIDQDDAGRWIRLLQVYDVERAPAVEPQGYRMIASDGGVFTFGWSPFHGSTGAIRLASPIVGGRSNGASGYWFVASDGGVFTFGDVQFYGSAAGRTTTPVVDMAVVPNGRGYWIAERGGRVHTFGEAGLLGDQRDPPPYAAIVNRPGRAELVAERPSSLPRLNTPIVAAHSTRSGNGTWYVAADGGVFTDGDAGFFGSTGAMRLNQPVLDLVPTPTEQGYWLLASDGGVFSFGDAEFLGSMGAIRLNLPVVGGVAGPSPSS